MNGNRVLRQICRAVALVVVVGPCCYSQTVNIWPGVAPGSEKWTQTERTVDDTPLGKVVFNVVTPTLTLYLPDKSKATGTGIIVAPGGSCVALAIDHEGTGVARWLQERGIAAFLLKYRIPEKKGEGIPKGINFDEVCKYGIADGIQAVKVTRQHAAGGAFPPIELDSSASRRERWSPAARCCSQILQLGLIFQLRFTEDRLASCRKFRRTSLLSSWRGRRMMDWYGSRSSSFTKP